jgi:sugar/nucleoside kinase (ribokinase family)
MRDTVLIVGRLYADLVLTGLPRLPRLGREDYAEGVLVAPGGGVFITAAWLKALGRTVEIAAALGDDPISEAVAATLARRDLASPSIERFEGGPQLTVALAVAGDRAFATHRAGPSVPAALRQRLAAGDVRHVHVAELATLLDAPWLVEEAHRAGASISLDIAWDDAAFADPRALALAASVDLMFPNEEEAKALTRQMDASIMQLMDALGAAGATVVLKRDRHGASVREGPFGASAPALPAHMVDATGAGDAFAAGYLDAWLGEADLSDALARALACGAFAIESAGGAENLPDRAAVMARAAGASVRREPVTSLGAGMLARHG